MTDLILHVKREYFEQMSSGEKDEEFRLCNDYWAKRLENRNYDRVVVCLGYPPKDDMSRRRIRPYRGFVKRTITHKHFNNKPVQVYAISVV
jgi:isochorismate hydrolase